MGHARETGGVGVEGDGATGEVAEGEDGGIGGARFKIDENAGACIQPGIPRDFIIGHGADADEDGIARDRSTIVETLTAYTPIITSAPPHAYPPPEMVTLFPLVFVNEVGKFSAAYAGATPTVVNTTLYFRSQCQYGHSNL